MQWYLGDGPDAQGRPFSRHETKFTNLPKRTTHLAAADPPAEEADASSAIPPLASG